MGGNLLSLSSSWWSGTRCVDALPQQYVIHVVRGLDPSDSWSVARRYSAFDDLNKALQPLCGFKLPLPPKKVTQDRNGEGPAQCAADTLLQMFGNTDPSFIRERKRGLQEFLTLILSHPILKFCHHIRMFLDDRPFVVTNFAGVCLGLLLLSMPVVPLTWHRAEEAMRGMSMFFRSVPSWEIAERLPAIGWRIRKRFFLARFTGDNPPPEAMSPCAVAWVPLYGETAVNPALLGRVLRHTCTKVSHPFVSTALHSAYHTGTCGAALTVRQFSKVGSLRDVVCRNKRPQDAFLNKYAVRKHRGLALPLVRLYGRQILEGLKFLHAHKIPYGHLHAGNVGFALPSYKNTL